MKTKIPLAMLISVEHSGEHGHMHGRFVRHSETDRHHFDYLNYEHPLEKFVIRSQCSHNSDHLYAWTIAYRAHDGVEMHEAREAVKMLAPFYTKMKAMRATEGDPPTFGHWVNRLARICGAKHIIVQQSDEWSRRHGTPWCDRELGAGIDLVNRAMQELLVRVNPSLAKQQEAA